MKKWTWFLVIGITVVFVSQSLVSANDPPHNTDSDVDCGACHGEALFATDPGSMTPEQLKDAYNAMCKRCHTSAAGSYHGTAAPTVGAHNDTIVQGSFTFDTSCIDCHHPHYQSDQFWYGRKYYGSEYRLFTGLGSVTSTLSNPTRTVINYTPASLSPKSGSSWDTSGPPDNDVEVGLANLANKTSSGRGAAFLPNTASPYNSHMIESINTTDNTITIKGTLTSVATAGFAIAYGQVVKREIPYTTAAGKTVILLDKEGQYSYAHNDGLGAGSTDSTVTGLCQVCHTQTSHWQQTPDAVRDDHYSGENCMACHQHLTGFKPNFVDHYDVGTPYVTDYTGGSEETCVSCHTSPGTYNVDRDYLTYVHNSTCANCHVDFDSPPTLRGGTNGDAQLNDGSNTCSDCHGATGGYNYHTDFENAHDVKDHDGLVGKTGATIVSNCNYCHTGDIVNLDATPDVHNDNCLNCHSNTGNDGSLVGAGGNGYGTTAGHVIGTTSSCADCHSARNTNFESHIHGDATNHKTGGSGTSITQAAGDVSQESGTLCSVCHQDLNGGATTLTSWDEIAYEHDLDGTKDGVGSCVYCHNATRDVCSDGSKCTQSGTTIQDVIAAGVDPTNCVACHEAKVDSTSSDAVHGTYDHATNPAGGLAYAPITKTADCTDNCHTGDVVALHANDCSVCHTTAPTLKSTPDLAQFAGTTTACIDCHKDSLDLDGAGPYTYHGISYGHSETLSRHNNLSNSDSSMTYDCQACHTDMSTTTLKLQKHMAADTVANCYRCHFPNVWGGLSDTPAQTAIGNGKGAGSAQTCEDCHTSKDTYLLHGLTAADVASDNEHNNLTTSGIAGDTDCANCHSMANETEKLNLHMSPTNTAHSGNCLTCHTAADDATPSGSASTVIAAGKGAGSAQQCNDCHIAKGSYLLHGLASNDVNDVHDNLSVSSNAGSGTETDCAECHAITTDVNRIDLHTGTTCSKCHTATGTAVTVIGNGWNSGTTANCESCHTAKAAYLRHGLTDDNGADGVVDVHDQFNIQTGSSTSTCSSASCHNTTAVNDIATMQLHTRAATPTTCLTCHQAVAPVPGVISAGWGSANAAQCDECHTGLGGDWYTHSVDHTASGLGAVLPESAGASRTVSCSSTNCHASAAQGDIITGVHDVYTSANICAECHDSGGALIDGNDGYGDARLGSGGGATCSTCHASGFDIHLHDHSSTVTFVPGTDESQAAPGTDCNICHGQGGASPYSLTTFANKLYEHDFVDGTQDGTGACTSCHDYDTRGNQTGSASTPASATVTDAIDANTTVTCIGCHAGKVQPNTHGYYDHATDGGLGYAPITKTATCTDNCHSGEVVVAVHADDCTICHTTAPTLKSTPDLAQFAGTTTACIDCHKDSLDLDGAGPYTYHGISYSHSETLSRHNNLSNSDSSMTYDCQACHTDMSTTTLKLQKHMAADTVANCYRCHFPNVWGGLSDTPAQTAIGNGKGAGSAQTCEDCHTAKDTYLLHGLTAADVASDNEHNNLTTSGIAGDTDCANCHSMANETEKLNLHMSPRNTAHSGNCLTCHTAADDATPSGSASTVIAAGKGAGSAQQCNDCHIAKGSYLRHGLASNTVNDVHDQLSVSTNAGSGTETDCAECHTITTDVNRIDLHTGTTCSKCHTATGTAVTVIGNGWNSGTTANCESCHTAKAAYLRHGLTDDNGADGVVDVHDQFNIQTGSATSTCSSASCHNTTAVNDIATMQLHTQAATPTTCLTCHQYAAPVSTVIAAGWGSANAAQCDECHTGLGGDWYTHSVDHTASGLNAVLPEPAGASRTVSCSSTNCHAAQGDIITGVHDVYTSANPCAECHNSGGTLIDGNDGYGDATLGAGGGATCSTCHASGFDIHLHDHSSTVTFVPGTDESQAAPGTDCNICHGQGGASPYSLSTFANKLYEHDFVNAPQDGSGACTSCHDYDTRGNQTGDPSTPASATVTGAIDNNTTVSCIGCHSGKVQPNTHGGHEDPDVIILETAACTACHDSQSDRNYVNDIHGRTWSSFTPPLDSRCEVCHINDVPGGPMQDYSGGGVIMPADTVDYAARVAIGTAGEAPCIDCHNSGGAAPNEIISVLTANWTETGGGPNGDVVITAKNVDASQVSVSYNGGGAQPMVDNAGTWEYTFNGQSYTDVATDYVTLTSVGLGNTTAAVIDRTDYARTGNVDQTDTFTGQSINMDITASNWTEATDAGDTTTQWMIWNDAATNTANTGPSGGNPGEYLVLESSVFTDPGGGGSVTIEDAFSNVGTSTSSPTSDAYTTQATAELLVVAVGIESSGTTSAVSSVTYAGSSLTQETVASDNGITMWVGSLDITAVADSGNIVVTATNVTEIHVHAATFSGADMAGTPVTALSAVSANSNATTIDVPTMTYAAGDQVVTVGHKAAFTSQYTGVSDEDANYTDGSLLSGSVGASIHSTRGVTTAGTNDGVTDPIITYEQTAGGGGNKSWMTAAGIVVNAAGGGGGDFDATYGDDLFDGSAPQYIERSYDASTHALNLSFDYNMTVAGTDARIYVDGWNGSSWDAPVATFSTQDAWTSTGTIDLSSYSNADFKVRIRYAIGTGNTYENDVALDNIRLWAVAEPSTLETVTITAADWTEGTTTLDVTATGPASMWGDYGADSANALTAGSLTLAPPSDGEYLANVRVYSAQGEATAAVTGAPPGATTYHPAYSHTITTSSNCATTCHTDTGAAIITGTHNVAINPDDCYLCHQSGTAAVIQAIYDGADGTPQNCANCHTAYNTDFDSAHTADTHNLLSAPVDSAIQSDDCDDCHTEDLIAVDGMHDTSNSGGYVSCSSCHTDPVPGGSNDGTLRDVALTNHTVGVASTCLTCHTATYFPSHTYDLSHTVAIDGDTSGGLSCDNGATGCHNNQSENWANIKTRHDLANGGASVCLVCHDSTRSNGTDAGTIDPAYTDESVQGVILEATGTVSCLDCHFDKSAAHGGHDSSHFAWTASCGTAACHDSTSNPDVANDIHGDGATADCLICHNVASGGTGTTDIGAAANGVDADAKLGNGAAPHAGVTCLTCHSTADADVNAASMGGIHHDNKGGTTDCTTACHTVSGYEGDHSNMISNSPVDCTSCHSGVVGGGTGAPIDGVDGSKHDTCTTCHQFAGAPAMNGILVSPPGGSKGVDTMNDSTPLNTTDGGGDCVDCHNAPDTWTTMHTGAPGVDHATSRVHVVGSNCDSCHDLNPGTNTTARNAETSPYVTGADNEVHASSGCATCHTGNDDGGVRTGGPFPKANSIGTGGNCEACHIGGTFTWQNIHDGAIADHSTSVANFATCTDSCHTGTGGNAAIALGSSNDRTNNMLHDACSTCHDTTTGAQKAFGTADTHNPDWITAMGTGACNNCHSGTYFDSHVHGYDTTEYVNHNVSHVLADDRSQNLDSDTTECRDCHDDNSGLFANWDDIRVEHETVGGATVSSCQTCHYYTDGGDNTPTEAQVTGNIPSVSTVSCVSCHVPKDHASGASSIHGGHAPADFQWTAAAGSKDTCGASANGSGCHDDSTATNVIGTIHNGDFATAIGGANANCKNCHNDPDTSVSPGDGNTGVGKSDGDGTAEVPPANATTHNEVCTTCHGSTPAAIAAIHHDRSEATGGTCITCHKPDVGQAAAPTNMPANLPCNLCHLYFPNGYQVDGSSRVIINANSFDPTFDDVGGHGAEWGAPPTQTALTTHTISMNTNPPISDYGACFACHGATSFTGSAGTSPQVRPYHGMGTPYTTNLDEDDGGGSRLGGTYDDVINAYAGPQTVTEGMDQPPMEYALHPGWKTLNWLAADIGWGSKGTADYTANRVSPGAHPNDTMYNTTTERDCTGSSFQIPWDNYAAAAPAPAAQTISVDVGLGRASINKLTNVPTVNLTLNSTNCPLPVYATQILGPDATGKDNGAENGANIAYIDPKPFNAAADGFITLTAWHNGSGNVTVFSCSMSGSTCTVTDSYDTQFDTAIPDGALTINNGDYVGYWMSTTGQTKFDVSGTDIMVKSTGTISKPAPSDAISTNSSGFYSNVTTTIKYSPY